MPGFMARIHGFFKRRKPLARQDGAKSMLARMRA
jgi:hypothetical protein